MPKKVDVKDVAGTIRMLKGMLDKKDAQLSLVAAEKLEEKARLEEKDKDIEELKTKLIKVYNELTTIIDDLRKERNNLMAQLESKDRELAQLKEIAEKMKEALREAHLWPNTAEALIKNSLTAYAEWCKQNLK